MRLSDTVRNAIRSFVSRERMLWNKTLKHSEDYVRALELHREDLETLQRMHPGNGSTHPEVRELGERAFARVTMNGATFALVAATVCGLPYGGEWCDLVLAVCLSQPQLNDGIGNGTSLITTIPDAWQAQLLERLRADDSPQRALH